MTHTPGPWRVNEYGILLGAADNVEIGRSILNGDRSLIAAAPELLAALRPFAAPTVSDYESQEQRAARAAIAKAEGKS